MATFVIVFTVELPPTALRLGSSNVECESLVTELHMYTVSQKARH